eukprot:290355-Pelagomonas_calceolata.AAC.2
MSVKGVVLALSLVAHSDMSVVVALAVPPRDLLTVGAYQPNGLAEVCPPNLHHCPAQCPLGCLKLATPASLKHCFVSICFVITHTAAHTHTHTCVHPGAGLQLKLAALREDDNVFDVSYEGQGEDSATASATDVKVGLDVVCFKMPMLCYTSHTAELDMLHTGKDDGDKRRCGDLRATIFSKKALLCALIDSGATFN